MPATPTVLAFDTSAAHCVAALVSGGELRVVRHEEMARGQGERLVVLLEEVLAEAGMTWADLDRIGVGIGPGNFTGIRISVSAARGLALGLGIPAFGVSLLDTTHWLDGRSRVSVPAPRGQVYWCDFDLGEAPALSDAPLDGDVASSAEHSAADHVVAMARIAAERTVDPDQRPTPLYVRPPDAAPSRETGPVILP